MTTGVMGGYARHSRPRDVERLPVLMISLSSYSSSTSYQASSVILAIKIIAIARCSVRTTSGRHGDRQVLPDARRAERETRSGNDETSKGEGMTTGGAMVIASTSWHTQRRHKALGREVREEMTRPSYRREGGPVPRRCRSSAPYAKTDLS
jgi:hypothetical protein